MAYPYGEPLENMGDKKDKWDFKEFEGRDSVDLLARMIYSEAEDQEYEGKQGVAHVAKNRKAYNNGKTYGKTYEEVLLKRGQFEGMTTSRARKPKLNSQAWEDALYIASNIGTEDNPIGNRRYFLPNKPKSSKAIDILQLGDHWFFNYK